ncbi:hypothetical protein HDV00_003133 [Rhizophlyctis rosea]|nr:hypothetical protein HDV00_003133 [Rhizophlyctis rosea]
MSETYSTKPESPTELSSETPPELPLEIHLAIGKLTDPTTIRNLRSTNKKHRGLFTDTDFIWTEAGWRYFTRGVKDCCYWAVRNGHARILELYVSELDKDTLGWMLKLAATKGLEDVVSVILRRDGIDGKARGVALERMAEAGHFGIVMRLLEAGPYTPFSLSLALFHAASLGNIQMTVMFLELGVHPHPHYAPLAAAAKGGHTDLVRLLLERFHHTPYEINSALIGAAKAGSAELARLLLSAGAIVPTYRVSMHGCPMLSACRVGDLETVKVIMSAGASVASGRGTALSPLSLAVMSSNPNLVRFLIEAGADIHEHNGYPLERAIIHNQIDIIKTLVKAGGSLLTADRNVPFLVVAAGHGNVEAVKVLLEEYVEQYIDYSLQHHQAALEAAAQNGHVGVVQLLLRKELNG